MTTSTDVLNEFREWLKRQMRYEDTSGKAAAYNALEEAEQQLERYLAEYSLTDEKLATRCVYMSDGAPDQVWIDEDGAITGERISEDQVRYARVWEPPEMADVEITFRDDETPPERDTSTHTRTRAHPRIRTHKHTHTHIHTHIHTHFRFDSARRGERSPQRLAREAAGAFINHI